MGRDDVYMTITRGFYRHYRGHVYYVLGVGVNQHDDSYRQVVYTSVKTEEAGTTCPGSYDFLLRSEDAFTQWVDPDNGEAVFEHGDMRAKGYVRRFERITDPERSKI